MVKKPPLKEVFCLIKQELCINEWCRRWESNPHSEEHVPKTCAYANSATPADKFQYKQSF